MMHGPEDSTRERLRQRLQRTSDCIRIEQFSNALDQRDRDHLATCTRCQAEIALWRAFTDAAHPSEDNSARRVAAELRRRLPWRAPTYGGARSGRWWRPHTPALLAASVLLVVAAGYVAWDPEPRVEEAGSVEHGYGYRDAGIRVVSPVGDLDRAPDELTWIAVNGNLRYDVRVLEVDGSLLWSTTSPTPRVPLPPALIEAFVPGKTLVWDVTARDSTGMEVAHSGTQRARVRVLSSPRRR
jgi:hypothetical protein